MSFIVCGYFFLVAVVVVGGGVVVAVAVLGFCCFLLSIGVSNRLLRCLARIIVSSLGVVIVCVCGLLFDFVRRFMM